MQNPDPRITRVAEIDAMFAAAKGWGSWMVSCSNERESLRQSIKDDDITFAQKYRARTSSGGRVS